MAYSDKVWKDSPDHTTPLSAAGLNDWEARIKAETDALEVLAAGKASLTADNEFTGDQAFKGLFTWRGPDDAVQIIAKPLGDGSAGLFDLTHDDSYGYLFHLHSGPNSGANVATIGIGLDYGNGKAILVAAKAAGTGLDFISHPSHTGGANVNLTTYSHTARPLRSTQYVGAPAFIIESADGEGFADGVSVGTTLSSALSTGGAITSLPVAALSDSLPSGATVAVESGANTQTWTLTAPASAAATSLTVSSQTPNFAYPSGSSVFSNVFTSATATFVAGDVGGYITATTSRGEANCFASNTTIASIVSTSKVTLSVPTIATVTAKNFAITGVGVRVNTNADIFKLRDRGSFEYFIGSGGGMRQYVKHSFFDSAAENIIDITPVVTRIRAYAKVSAGSYTRGDILFTTTGVQFKTYASAAIGSESSSNVLLFEIQQGSKMGFYGATPVTKPTGVAVTAAGVHAALVSLGLIAA